MTIEFAPVKRWVKNGDRPGGVKGANNFGMSAITCPCGEKNYFVNKRTAQEGYANVTMLTGRKNEVRFYTCESGSTHWTRMIDNAPTGEVRINNATYDLKKLKV